MNTLLSLYDYTGNWPLPFKRAGWIVYQLDLKLGVDALDYDTAEKNLMEFEDVHGIIAAPDCSKFTASSAWKWPEYDKTGQTNIALQLVHQVRKLADLFRPTDPDYYQELGLPFFWVFENPAGRLPELIPELDPPMYFQPWEYGGYLDLSDSDHNELDRIRRKDGKGVSAGEAEFIIECNAYTKLTGLWGQFCRHIPKKPIEPVRACKAGSPLMRLGGTSEKTKQIRATTPLGFAKAFYQANKDYQAPLFKPKQGNLFRWWE